MLFMVYDPKGEPFEVRPNVAKNLVISQGWSMTPPHVVTPEQAEALAKAASDAEAAAVAAEAAAKQAAAVAADAAAHTA